MNQRKQNGEKLWNTLNLLIKQNISYINQVTHSNLPASSFKVFSSDHQWSVYHKPVHDKTQEHLWAKRIKEQPLQQILKFLNIKKIVISEEAEVHAQFKIVGMWLIKSQIVLNIHTRDKVTKIYHKIIPNEWYEVQLCS